MVGGEGVDEGDIEGVCEYGGKRACEGLCKKVVVKGFSKMFSKVLVVECGGMMK